MKRFASLYLIMSLFGAVAITAIVPTSLFAQDDEGKKKKKKKKEELHVRVAR